ncbi:MAG TPA: hydrogen peroxide-dependent heme synthase [Symbiobacteriaceae bacterium]|nr:hydrogen peroxide-dependent heme synthase [Symbiobacteriaceae bacterium]
MADVPGTLEGWYALHSFHRIDWSRWLAVPQSEQEAILAEALTFFQREETAPISGEGASALYQVIGHKADLMQIHLRPTLEDLLAVELAFNELRIARFVIPTYSYFSVTELSLYEAQARGGGGSEAELMAQPFVQKRLKPPIPAEKNYVCFYPMNKRRGETVNWYAADYEERRRLMREHATTGRKYAEQITQMITGSTGLDDWEWGVTLFGSDPLPIKKLVYEMRFDEVSAKYAEFGSFYVGRRVPVAELAGLFRSRA